jgi:hypothetical protein
VKYSTEKREKLKGYYDSLLGQREIFSGLSRQKQEAVSQPAFNGFQVEVQRAGADFPELLPPLDVKAFGSSDTWKFYEIVPILTYLSACIGRLKAALEEAQNTSVTERLEFGFVKEPGLRDIIERDYVEIQRAYISECWKSVVIVSGGSIEAILLDRLLQDSTSAAAAKNAPSGKSDLSRWDLAELIKVAVELKLVEPSAEILANAVRQYRNLVHPGNELRNKLQVGNLEANSALTALQIVHRDLSK